MTREVPKEVESEGSAAPTSPFSLKGQSSGSVSTPQLEEKGEANSGCHLEKLEEDLKEQQRYFEQQKEERQKRNRAGYGKKGMAQYTTMNFHYSKVTEVI